jgi:hypothetical protein
VHSADLPGKLAGRLGGRASQVPLQQALQLPILPQRGGGLPGSGVQAHQLLVPGFPERIGGHGLVRVLEGPGQHLPALDPLREPPQRLEEERGETLPLDRDPILKVAREQSAPVELKRFLQATGDEALFFCRRRERGFEPGYVRDDRRRIETDRAAVPQEHGPGFDARRLELAAEGGERLAEVVAGRLGILVGPEKLAQHLARMEAFPVVGEVGEERGRLLGSEPPDRPLFPDQAQSPEQLDPPVLCHPPSGPPDATGSIE